MHAGRGKIVSEGFLRLVQCILAAPCRSAGSQVACQADTSAICAKRRERAFLGFFFRSLLSLGASEVQVGSLLSESRERAAGREPNSPVQRSARLEGQLPGKI